MDADLVPRTEDDAPVVQRLDWAHPQPDVIERASQLLAGGGVVVLPTDTVYGIAQSVAACPQGALRLFQIKRRPADKTIAWLIADAADLDVFGTRVPAYAHALARELWPGGLTLVVRASQKVPSAYQGAGGTIGLRVPDAPVVRALARASFSPLATTSANTSGLPSPQSFAQLEPRVASLADLVLDDGMTHAPLASTVVVCTEDRPVVTRQGTFSEQLIKQICTPWV